MKTHPEKLPTSIYVIFAATIIANALATYLILRFFAQ